MTCLFYSWLAIGLLLASGPARAGGYVLTPVDDTPNPNATFVLGMNNIGDLVGYYYLDDEPRRPHHGFLLTASGLFRPIDVPGSMETEASGINDSGDVVGWYTLSGDPNPNHGFLFREPFYTTIDVSISASTFAYGINNAGDIVGAYYVGSYHGFLLRDDQFTTIDFAFNETSLSGINDAGQIAGMDRRDGWGFVRSPDGFFDVITAPGAQYTQPFGISNTGQVVGTYLTSNNHGFLWSARVLTTIDVPVAEATYVTGINVDGEIAGYYWDALNQAHGFRGTPR